MFDEVSRANSHYDVCVVGLGYVGLTFAVSLCEAGLRVLGVEINAEVVESLKRGVPHFQEVGMIESLSKVVQDESLVVQTQFTEQDTSDYYVITVGTPLGQNGTPREDFIIRAAREVSERLRCNDTVILRSTVAIGTTNRVVRKVLSKSGVEFNLSMCPERTLEGNAMKELRQLPQIIGADDERSKILSEKLFRSLTNIIVNVSSCEAAEVIKLADNTFRDVSFAFGNEIARICEAAGVSADEVIRSGKFGYRRTDIAMPGLVGGPCLEKDPHILIHSMKRLGLSLNLTSAARSINEGQPNEIIGTIRKLCKVLLSKDNLQVTVAGIAFKGVPATDDMRGSMSLKLIDEITRQLSSSKLRIYDPVIERSILEQKVPNCTVCDSLETAVEGADLLIIANNHPLLGSRHPSVIKNYMNENSFIFDFWNHFSDLDNLIKLKYYFPLGSVNYVLAEELCDE